MQDSEEFLVRLESADIKFPKVCPICGEPATKKGIILTSLRIRSNPRFSPRSGYIQWPRQPPTHVRKGLDIPICEQHFLSDAAKKRIRGPSGVCGGLLVLLLLFVITNVVFRLMDRMPVSFYWYLLLVLSLGLSVITLLQLGPSELDTAISIKRVEIGSSWIVLKLRNQWYLDELLRLNPETTRRVTIMRKKSDGL